MTQGTGLAASRVLVIDDDNVFRHSLARALRRHGLVVSDTGHYAAVLRLAEEQQPDFVLLDLNLGDDSGINLIAPLRAALPGCRIVVLSGCGNLPVAVNCIKQGAADYLVKPVEASAILAALFKRDLAARAVPSSERMPLEALERAHISQVLAENDGNISRTAEILKMHRRTLQRKLSKFQPASRGNEAGARDVRRSGCTGETPGPA